MPRLCPLVALFPLFFAACTSLKAPPPRVFEGSADLISVTGVCTRDVLPDRAIVLLGSEVRDAKKEIASQKAVALYETALTEAKALHLKDAVFETTELELEEWFEYVPLQSRNVSRGWIGRTQFKVSTPDAQRAGELLQLAKRLGLTRVQGPAYTGSDALATQVYLGCLEEAVRDAKMKAERIARAAGEPGVGPLFSARDPGPSSVRLGRFLGNSNAKMGAETAPTVELQPDRVVVGVEVTFKSR